MLSRCILIILVLFGSTHLLAQREFITINRANGLVELPFVYENHFIIVPVVLNGILPLRFIFDTGAENTVLVDRTISDILAVDYQRKVTIYGADLTTKLEAHVAAGINFEFNDQLHIDNQTVLILEEDYFRFDLFAGIQIHGIIGADIMRRFVVKIDYQRRKITLQDPSRFQPLKHISYRKIPVEFARYKPYLTLPGGVFDYQEQDLKLLMDTGASLALLLYVNRQDSLSNLPDNLIPANIGMGLGGQLDGFVGRTARVKVGEYVLQNVITKFQDVAPLLEIDSTFLNNRHGTVGNKILERFTVILDYIHEEVYLRSNRRLSDRFVYDRSGLSIAGGGNNLVNYVIINVIPNSPAAEAGIFIGDQIKRVNGLPTFMMDLEGIIARLQRKPGKKIKLLIDRQGRKIKRTFKLRELI